MDKKVITFGEIMLRLATPDYLRFCQSDKLNATFGGGEANVAVSLANYGIATEFVTRLPKNDIARACVMDLRKYGVGTSHIVYGGDRLGIYFLETGAVARASKVGYLRNPTGNGKLGRSIQRCILVPLDRHYTGHFTGCGRCLPRSYPSGKPYGYPRIMRP